MQADVTSALGTGHASAEQLGQLARVALAEQREEEVLPLLQQATRTSRDARLWQWRGLLERALDEHAEALASLAKAAAAAPRDPSIAHGRARTALEAGVQAVDLFAAALRLAPSDPQVYLGLNAARISAGLANEAEEDLDRVLLRSPLWLDGHHQLAQLRSLRGKRDRAFDSLERAIRDQPKLELLWQALLELNLQAEDYESVDKNVGRARSSGVSPEWMKIYEFIAASELDRPESADAVLKTAVAIPAVWQVRHRLRSGQLDRATALIEAELKGPQAPDIWPYAATAWQMTGDSRGAWLTGSPNLISVMDLSDELGKIEGLAGLLRSLHRVQGRYLNQSVRGGSQTDGPLFSRIDPQIRALRAVVVRAIQDFSKGLTTLPENHPQRPASPCAPVRFSGSWSVRLVGGGFHASHVHPRGRFSSALYINLPQPTDDDAPHAGWLSLGEPPPELNLGLEPSRLVQPRVGQLVLFPSWMWHGTRPFSEGERLTVAFDVAMPVAAPQSSSSS